MGAALRKPTVWRSCELPETSHSHGLCMESCGPGRVPVVAVRFRGGSDVAHLCVSAVIGVQSQLLLKVSKGSDPAKVLMSIMLPLMPQLRACFARCEIFGPGPFPVGLWNY